MKKLLIILALLLSAAACAPPYRQTFTDEGTAKGWTKKQTDAAYAYADRIFWSHEMSENHYVIVYGKIPISKVRELMETTLKNLDEALNPKNPEYKQYLDTFNLRKDLQHDELIAQAIYMRLHASELQTEFKQSMGDLSESGPDANSAKDYDVRKLFVAKPLVEAFPFNSDRIDAAKKAGTLKQIEQVISDESIKYDHKISDPRYPDDDNAFLWKSRNQKVVFTEYKIIDIDKPLDNKGDYIEGYRVINGKQESKPSIKVFFTPDNESSIVLVCTTEEGTPGYGIPDEISKRSINTDAHDLVHDVGLINSLFDKKEAKKDRDVAEAQLFKVEILPIGGHIDEWQKSPDAEGWLIPFKYMNQEADNYNARIKFKKPKLDPNNPDAVRAHEPYQEIEYIEKEYTKTGDRYEPSVGRVVEYYRPRINYAGKLKAQMEGGDDDKKISFEFPDGSTEIGIIAPGKNKFIEDSPFAKAFNEGQKRWWIEKSEGSKVYDKRKLIGQPNERLGEYKNENEESEIHVRSDDNGNQADSHKSVKIQ